MMVINLTQHPASPEQVAAGVQDLPSEQKSALQKALTFDELPAAQEIFERAQYVAALAAQNGLGGDDGEDPCPRKAMIGGAPFLMAALEKALKDMGITPVYAFSARESVEEIMADGSVRKVAVFRHKGFVES